MTKAVDLEAGTRYARAYTRERLRGVNWPTEALDALVPVPNLTSSQRRFALRPSAASRPWWRCR